MATVLWNHAPGMFRRIRSGRSYPQLNTQEMADILAFLYQASKCRSCRRSCGRPPRVPGKRMHTCHAVRSEGGKSAPDLATVALAEEMSEWVCAMWNHTSP